jgi:hypothetical protein
MQQLDINNDGFGDGGQRPVDRLSMKTYLEGIVHTESSIFRLMRSSKICPGDNLTVGE